MNNIPKEGEIWAYGKVEYEIGCIRRKGEINIRKHKKEHDWIGYDITHFTSNLWKKISNSPNNIIPEKWCIKITNDNARELNQFLKEKCHEYIGYVGSWDPERKSAIGFYMVYPQIEKHSYSYQGILSKYNCKEITTEFFREHILKKNNKEELINKLTTTKKEENYECTSKNKSIKVCRPDFKVSEGLRKRGIGIKSTGVKILIGNRYCNN